MMSFEFVTFFEWCRETIKTIKCHWYWKWADRMHYSAILLKLLKGLKLVSSLHNGATNKFEMFFIGCTNSLANFILIPLNILKKQWSR